MKAFITQGDGFAKIQEIPKPSLQANEILLKTISVGLNPTDWKHISRAKEGNIAGCDFVGEVVEIGQDVPTDQYKIGEKRWGFVRGSVSPNKGAFAEYVAAIPRVTGVVPPNLTPQEAASVPIPFLTAVQALYLRLGLPQYPAKANGEWIVIWSGGSAVGQFAIQLAKLSGLRVATAASISRTDQLKALGADAVVDYKDPEYVQKLKAATEDAIQYGLDCIGACREIQPAFRPEGGHLVSILFDLENLPRPEVKTESTIAYSILGEDVPYGKGLVFPATAEDQAIAKKWANLSTELFEKEIIKPLKVTVVGGFEAIPEGLELLRSGKNATKLVANV